MSLRIHDELNPLGHSLLDLRQSYGEDGNCGAQPQRHAAHRFLVPGPFMGCRTFELLHPKLDYIRRHARQVFENIRRGEAVRSLERMVWLNDERAVSMKRIARYTS